MGGETIWVELLRVLAALVVVVPTAYVVTRFLGGRARPRRGRYMTLVESLPLGAQRGLHLVQVGERFFLVGGSERGITLLAEVDGPVVELGEAVERLPGGKGLPWMEAARVVGLFGRRPRRPEPRPSPRQAEGERG